MENVKQYRKKPVIIEAIQWSGNNTKSVIEFIEGYAKISYNLNDDFYLQIRTLEGNMKVEIGDYVIKEPSPTFDKIFYPCKPDIFKQTYDEM